MSLLNTKNASVSTFRSFFRPKRQISLSFYIPEAKDKRYPSRPEVPSSWAYPPGNTKPFILTFSLVAGFKTRVAGFSTGLECDTHVPGI